MPKLRQKSKIKSAASAKANKKGFTVIEVMLTLAVTGVMLAGLIASSYTTIARQRYNDALNGFAEHLSRVYSEVLSPVSLGLGNSGSTAVLGKVLVFGYDYGDDTSNRSVYSATLVGSASINRPSDQSFYNELKSTSANVQLFCGNRETSSTPARSSTVEEYTPLWDTEFLQASSTERFKGTIIIARTPTSSAVHTIYSSQATYNLRDGCTPDSQTANTRFVSDLRDSVVTYKTQDIDICLKSADYSITRQILLASDGSNTSAVKILDEEASQCL